MMFVPRLELFFILIVSSGVHCDTVAASTVSKSNTENGAFYDFIIVGAGQSGCVVAGRLSEKYKVLLLGTGGDPGDVLDIPATTYNLAFTPEYSKFYSSVPQKDAGLSNNGIISYTIGNTLGGGSSVNGMIYNRGSALDYDYLANVTNDSSWKYSNLLKYFKRIEDYDGSFNSDDQHGQGGPIPVTISKYAPGMKEWLEAGKYLGYPIADPNGPQKISFSPVEFSKKFGKRVSAYKGYIKPHLESRPNLKVLQHSQVLRILFKGSKAIGVQYMNTQTHGTFEVFASKEIIISAGTMDSPAILMRSGIGEKNVLESANIRPVKILPVGQNNLQDHVMVKLDFVISKDTADILIPERDLTPENLRIFEETGDGPYSSCWGIHAQTFHTSSNRAAMGQADWADLTLILFQTSLMKNISPVDSEELADNEVSTSVVIFLGRPKSRGSVLLNPDDVNGPPLIDFQYFNNTDDLNALVEGVKLALKIMEKTPSFQKLNARYSKKPLASCDHLHFRSDDYWRCFIRYMANTCLHAAGTCRMGNGPEDPTAVVDSTLKVIGVQGLRVVDASIMPNVTNANIQAAVYVIAEKAAEQIIIDWQHSHEEL